MLRSQQRKHGTYVPEVEVQVRSTRKGYSNAALVAEIHPLLEAPQPLVEESQEQIEELDADIELPAPDPNGKNPLTYVTEQFVVATTERAGQLDWDLVEKLVGRSDGIPEAVGVAIKNAATSAAFE